ncbi:MAG TPA: MoaD/ThiS family protein [Thermodesulfobacteriota bacterium]|nr:MoaD/ThiS family protein [Thermodesulfobacteriota bacterium]
MKVTVAALLSVRRILGWSQKEIIFSGGTLADLLKQIDVPGGSNLYKLLIQADGTPNPKYRFALNQQIVDKEALNINIKDRDRLVALDALYIPSLTC